jgi:hypothetical protein
MLKSFWMVVYGNRRDEMRRVWSNGVTLTALRREKAHMALSMCLERVFADFCG